MYISGDIVKYFIQAWESFLRGLSRGAVLNIRTLNYSTNSIRWKTQTLSKGVAGFIDFFGCLECLFRKEIQNKFSVVGMRTKGFMFKDFKE